MKYFLFSAAVLVISCNTIRDTQNIDCNLIKMIDSSIIESIYKDLNQYKLYENQFHQFENNTNEGVLLLIIYNGLLYGDLVVFDVNREIVDCTRIKGNEAESINIVYCDSEIVKNLIENLDENNYIQECRNTSASPYYLLIVKRNGKEIVKYFSMFDSKIARSNLNENERNVIDLLKISRKYNYLKK